MRGENISYAYGFRGLVIVNVGLFAFFLMSFPVLIYVYNRLSKREEEEMTKAYGDEYRRYMGKTPMLIPKWGGKRNAKAPV